MALVSNVIRYAFRESNIIPLTASPNDAQATEALQLLNSYIASLYGDRAGEKLADWPLGQFGRADPQDQYCVWDWDLPRITFPLINRRLLVTNEEAMTVHLPAMPQDGSRMAIVDPYSRLDQVPVVLDGNGRTIEGLDTLTLNEAGTAREWIYRADKAGWDRLTDLTLIDEIPFPEAFTDYFTTSLAMRLNPRYGREMDAQTLTVYQRQQRRFTNQYLQSLPLAQNFELSWPFMSRQSYLQGILGTSGAFATGRAY